MISRQQQIVYVSLIIVMSIVYPTGAESPNPCKTSCGPNKRVPYPFGFSSSCAIKLSCSNDSDILVGGFRVHNITSSSILVDLPAQCNRTIDLIRPLFGSNYALTSRNSLLLQNCTSKPNACTLPTSLVLAQFNLQGCDANISCFAEESRRNTDMLSYENVSRTNCTFLFSSAALDRDSLQLQRVELGWWLGVERNRNCSKNSYYTPVPTPDGKTGFRCGCKDGFKGDGYDDGDGCKKVSNCNLTRYLSGHCGGMSRVRLLLGGIVAGASIMAALCITCYFVRRRSTCLKNEMSARRLLCEAAGNSSVPLYPYREVERATNNFSDGQRLGTGAFGTVYAGKLQNDEWVAIKKIKYRDTNSIDQVLNEIKLLSSVSHPNLVRLLGCCIEDGEQILVYEFMPNGTLSEHLQRERGKVLPWTVRLTIAAETAHAITYLHSAMNPPIYHRDIKSSNILLDHSFKSKVADFGLSRLGMTEISHISTAPQGTPGYVDPQYHQNFHLTDKSDVYSFGVVLIEIITALKVVDFARPPSEVNLAALAIDRIGRGCVDEIIDPFLEPNRDAWTLYSVHKVAELAFRCLAFHSDTRPSMMEVAEELEHIRRSGWSTLEENACIASSAVSSCSSPHNGSKKSLGGGGMTVGKAGLGSQRSVVPEKVEDCAASMEEVKDSSPVSVYDPWLSRESSPSANSLLGNGAR
ncbi:wall-associated receptor kinase-like 14 [Juglans microcarpa x Juglans regia]|uniref:wall-associated receptor kinase-like 14 n=1 Tax=Juglans microcarpa x Juglans regia TaxID=2249226 RepID=UPI001B7F154A|nr:wall-associated receptor kinase-like 14 [Juglans microcarpa x Juglans regia]XP_041001192.1 wall-associated receptor kinase-like 14 [Juglans microcarpa x Juglans regia]